jgi:hypothetical protein
MNGPQIAQISADSYGVNREALAGRNAASFAREPTAVSQFICVNLRNLRTTPALLFDHL